jgi:hypothetical protein
LSFANAPAVAGCKVAYSKHSEGLPNATCTAALSKWNDVWNAGRVSQGDGSQNDINSAGHGEEHDGQTILNAPGDWYVHVDEGPLSWFYG